MLTDSPPHRLQTEDPRCPQGPNRGAADFGHKIARLAAGKSQAERAAVAANLYLRGFAIQNPTIKQLPLFVK